MPGDVTCKYLRGRLGQNGHPVSDWGLLGWGGESNRTVRRDDRAIGRELPGVSRERLLKSKGQGDECVGVQWNLPRACKLTAAAQGLVGGPPKRGRIAVLSPQRKVNM